MKKETIKVSEQPIALQNPLEDERLRLQNFLSRLQQEPSVVEKTPDGKANTVPISHVEMTLDELYFGMWVFLNLKPSALKTPPNR